MPHRSLTLCLATLAALSPVWADVTGSVSLTQGATLDLDTGAVGSGAAADLVFTGTGGALATLGNGTVFALNGATGTTRFQAFTVADLALVTNYNTGQLAEVSLAPGAIIFARTKTGKYSKLLIANKAVGTLVVAFTTFTSPFIVSVQNNFGQLPAGVPNSVLAPGSLIALKGFNLSTVNDGQTLRSSAAPGLQTVISGVRVTVSVQGTTLDCPLYYLSPGQINAVLPGNTPPGSGTITVTSGQERSTAFNLTVVPGAFGIVFYDGSKAATYDASNTLITAFNAANPGQTIVIWGSGVGSDPGNDDRVFPQKINNLAVPMQVLVGGRLATILYRGRSQFPGVDQIVVTLPDNTPVGCYVSLAVVTGNVVSNGATIPVAARGKTCADPGDPLPPEVLQSLNARPAARLGYLSIEHNTDVTGQATPSIFAVAEFLLGPAAYLEPFLSRLSPGSCLTTSGSPASVQGSGALDAGPTLNLAAVNGTIVMNRQLLLNSAIYSVSRGLNLIDVAGGEYQLFNPSSGPDIQQFSTSVVMPSAFRWTNSASLATVNRAGLTFTWSGGANATYVAVKGRTQSGGIVATFECLAPASAGQFTVPPSVLLAMPAGAGLLYVDAVTQSSFKAPGLDFGLLKSRITFLRTTRF